MPFRLPVILGLGLILATGARAQGVNILPQREVGQPSEQALAQAQDPGRLHVVDRGGLSGRGGANPTGSDRTFSATIGSRISGTMSHPMGSQIGPR